MPAMQTLVHALQKAIDSEQVSVTQVAKSAHVSRQYIYNVLEGKSVPTFLVAERLANAIGASIRIVEKKSKKRPS